MRNRNNNPGPCLCGADDCPSCYPGVRTDRERRRQAREEARADWESDVKRDAEFDDEVWP